MTENILILTPYHDFGEMLRLGLAESQTYFPYLTHNSAEALLVASQDKFSLAIIDTEIPGPSFRELWKDLKTMQPDMQLVLIFPEAEDEYPSLDGIAPLGCVDHLLYMPEFLELIDSAFPTLEESISTPAPNQESPAPEKQEITQPEQQPEQLQDYDVAWLEDTQIASEHLEKKLPVCSAQAAMIARSDKVLAYSDQLEVAAAQEIANRFTRYWNKDGKNSDLVRFIHLGPMNNAFLLYVTDLANDAVLAALYQADTPLSQPHRQISKLARILLNEAPALPDNNTGSLKMDFVDDDVYSQRMRMVTGSLRPLATAAKEEPVQEEFVEAEDSEEPEDVADEVFDPEQFHLEELLSRMPSPDPVAPETPAPAAPVEKFQEPEPESQITQNAVESLRYPWDSEKDVTEEAAAPPQNVAKRKPSPWETDGSLDITETPIKKIEEKETFPWESNTSSEVTQEIPIQDAEKNQAYPWETEASIPDEPVAPTQDAVEDQPFPWETGSSSTIEPEPPAQDAVESLRYPWESGTGSLEEPASNEPDNSIEMTQKIEPSNPQNAVESLRYPWESEASSQDDSSPSASGIDDEMPQEFDPFASQDTKEDLQYPWKSDTGNLGASPSSEFDKADEMPQEIDPLGSQDSMESRNLPWQSDTGKLDASSSSDPDESDETAKGTGPFISQDAVESKRNPWETHTAHLTPPPPKDADEPEALEETQTQDAVESLRSPMETNTASLSEQPPNGHEEFNEDDFEPLPDFTDLESASESPLGNGWEREDDTEEGEGEDDGENKAGTSPLKHPANKAQPVEEEEDEYSDCVYTYTTFVTPLLKRHALTRELAQILAKSMNTVCEKNHWKLLNMTARPSGMLWTARIPPNVTTGQMVKIIREETSEMLYEVHPRLKYEALSENFWAANYLVVSGNEAPDDDSIKEFLHRIHQTNRSNGSRH